MLSAWRRAGPRVTASLFAAAVLAAGAAGCSSGAPGSDDPDQIGVDPNAPGAPPPVEVAPDETPLQTPESGARRPAPQTVATPTSGLTSDEIFAGDVLVRDVLADATLRPEDIAAANVTMVGGAAAAADTASVDLAAADLGAVGALSAEPVAPAIDETALAVSAVGAFREICILSLGDPNTAVTQLYSLGFTPSPANGLRYERESLIAGLDFRDFSGPRSCYVGAPVASAETLVAAFDAAMRSATIAASRDAAGAPRWELTLSGGDGAAAVEVDPRPSAQSADHAALRLDFNPSAPR